MRLVAKAVLLGALVVAGACHAGEAPTAPPTDANVVGRYNLTLVNGGPLPFPYFATATTRIDIIGGSLTLTPDHQFTDLLTRRETLLAGGSGSDQTDTLSGSWQLDSHNLTLTYTGLGVQAAIVTGNLISINAQGLSLAYNK